MGEDRAREGRRAPREERREERRDWREPTEREDFGQADFSSDYAYDPERRAGRRTADDLSRGQDDYGQADYSSDYGFDPERGRAYRRFSEDDRDYADDRAARDPPDRPYGERSRSWADRASSFFTGRDEAPAQRRRRGPSDRVLWAVIVERLEDERGLDLRDVEVLVENAEVTLNGTVRRKEDKRRIEDVADLHGVRHVQNNLRVRGSGRRWF
jgi:hypothetical protein